MRRLWRLSWQWSSEAVDRQRFAARRSWVQLTAVLVAGSACAPAADDALYSSKGNGKKEPGTLVLVRHGLTEFNVQMKFTGWLDPDITPQGEREATAAGEAIRAAQDAGELCAFTHAYRSVLTRAKQTLDPILARAQTTTDACVDSTFPIKAAWQLNERHYGDLQGLDRLGAISTFGTRYPEDYTTPDYLQSEDHPRFSYGWKPPLLDEAAWYKQKANPLYTSLTEEEKNELPRGESLEGTWLRIKPYWEAEIVPKLLNGGCIIISGHGNTFRALGGQLEKIKTTAYPKYKFANAVPHIYRGITAATLQQEQGIIPTKLNIKPYIPAPPSSPKAGTEE